ncbi:MAG TPA: serine hydrolase [Gemmatales bacterium]|nr:serine hydrolase [Gemmatales bacterium]HMP58259.1 serine hydrolase [Gemmatales bacterium]
MEAELLKEIGAERWAGLCHDLVAKHGRARQARAVKMVQPFAAEMLLAFDKDVVVPVQLAVHPLPPYRLVGVRFGEPKAFRDSWELLRKELEQLPGTASGLVARLDAPGPAFLALRSDQPLAVASSFKLLILLAAGEAVAAGERKWSDSVLLRAEWKSLPSGWLQDWPVGSPVTWHTLALLMLSRSDNTAADHLLHTLGRDRLHALQERLGLDGAGRNRPFLSTGELFRLKLMASPELQQRYLRAGPDERQRLLATEIAALAWQPPPAPTQPRLLNEIEWFLSARDLAKALDALRTQGEATTTVPLLGMTPPFPVDPQTWPVLGFKGGAECGAFNASLLVRHRSGAWYALVLTWNDPSQDVAPARLLELQERALLLLERAHP